MLVEDAYDDSFSFFSAFCMKICRRNSFSISFRKRTRNSSQGLAGSTVTISPSTFLTPVFRSNLLVFQKGLFPMLQDRIQHRFRIISEEYFVQEESHVIHPNNYTPSIFEVPTYLESPNNVCRS